jgi:DNA polymerase-3 subunit epsilon
MTTPHRQIILDTETTGLSPREGHRIIEIGCVELVDRRLTGNHLHLYVNPGRGVELGAVQVHGITEDQLVGKPMFHQVAQEVMAYLTGAELVIHNAPFDMGFLNNELNMLPGKPFKALESYCTVTDTLAMARKMFPGQRNSLDALCRRYDINNKHRTLHGALLDSEILAQVYLAMTGGQETLSFDVVTETSATHAAVNEAERFDIPVLKATDAEIALDQKYREDLS